MTAKKEQREIKKTEIELYTINKVRELRESRNVGQKRLSLE